MTLGQEANNDNSGMDFCFDLLDNNSMLSVFIKIATKTIS